MMPVLSVVVCTYNRSFWLRNCLNSLEKPCADGSMAEVLIVDNNSSDDTREVATEYTLRLPNFRYVFETAQGLSHARNRGYKEAQGEYVAYIDDDAQAHADWVTVIIRFFEVTPQASGVGGPHEGFSTVEIPPWFPKEMTCRSLGNETREIRDGEWISGTNMVFRKTALEEMGGFNTEIGMTGDKVSYGEETNLVIRMRERGMQIYYCADMVVDHAVLPHKISLWWLLKSRFANGYDGINTFGRRFNVITYLPYLMRQLVIAMISLVCSREPYFKARIYQSFRRLFWDLGYFVRLMKS